MHVNGSLEKKKCTILKFQHVLRKCKKISESVWKIDSDTVRKENHTVSNEPP